MKLIPTVLTLIAFTSPAMAEFASPEKQCGNSYCLTGHSGIANNFINRGYSMSDNDPQVFTKLYATLDNGFSAGMGGSTLELLEANSGWGFHIANNHYYGDFAFGATAVYYTFPESHNFDYWEFNGHMSYDASFAKLTTAVYYSPKYFGNDGQGWYKSARLTVPVADGLGAYAQFGHQSIKTNHNFWDYQVGVTYKLPLDGYYDIDIGFRGNNNSVGMNDDYFVTQFNVYF